MVLDAGCGTGSYSDALLHYVGRIEAVDMNAAMLEVAARKLAWAGDRIFSLLQHRGAALRGREPGRGDDQPGTPPSA